MIREKICEAITLKKLKKIVIDLRNAYRDMDKVLFFVAALLFVFGLINILTASSREAVVNNGVSMTYYFKKQLEALIIAFFACNVIYIIPTKKYYKYMFILYVFIMGLIGYLVIWGKEINGAKNWLTFKYIKFSFQPSEVMKIIVICALALLFEKYYRSLKDKFTSKNKLNHIYIYIITCFMAPMLLIFLQKDLGTMFVIFVIAAVLYLLSPINNKDKFKMIGYAAGLGIIGLLIIFAIKGSILTPAQKARLTNFFKPCDTYETGGYQVCNCFIAINNGGLFGVGPGKSTQKYSFIPEPHTDSVFAIFAEEYGVLGAIVLFFFYLVIIKRIINISSNAKTIRGRFITLGIAIYIMCHIFINLGGIFGLIPLTGIPLPFLSYGGTYAITLAVAIAIVERIDIESKKQIEI